MSSAPATVDSPPAGSRFARRGVWLTALLWSAAIAVLAAGSIDYRLDHHREGVIAAADARSAAVRRLLETSLREWAAIAVHLSRRRAVGDFLAARAIESGERFDAAAWQAGYDRYVERPEVVAMGAELAALADDFGLPFVALAGPAGQVLATTARSGNRRSGANADLSARDYFRGALESGQGSQFLLGAVSGVPGMYFASRVERDGRVLGVAVAKQDRDVLNQLLADVAGHAVAVTDPNGVVVLSNRDDWLLRRLPDVAAPSDTLARQLYQNLPQPLSWSVQPMQLHGREVSRASVDGIVHLVSRTAVPGQPLTTWVLAPLDEERGILARFGGALLLLWMLGLGLIAFGSRRMTWMQQALEAQRQANALMRAGRASDERFAAVYEHAINGYVFFTARDGIDQCNPAALQMFGATQESELLGRILWHPPLSCERQGGRSGMEAAREALDAHRHSRARVHMLKWRFRRQDGREFDAEVAVIALEWGQPTRYCAVIQDVTAQRETESAMESARVAAEAASRAKSSFLANMSHELRTPMNAVIGMTHLALEDGLPPRQRDYVEKAHRSARALLAILNDVLDMSKIESGQLELERIDFAVETVVSEMADVLGLRADEKQLELLFRAGADLPRRLVGDPTRLRQVLVNLGGNAIKFTDAGEVTVGMELQSQEGHEVVLHGWVEDTGVGIGAAEQERLFQPFAQADSSTTRRFGGTGLGLSISRQLVERMGGRLWVDSEPGRGSTFHFTARFGRSTAADAAPRARMLGAVHGRRALLVDDNAAALEVLGSMLRSLGVEVDAVNGGVQALERLEAQPPGTYAWVLLDWKMPGMDGVTLARRILERRDGPHPCILLVTAFARDEAMRAAEGTALAGVLQKPVTPSSLYDCLVETRRRVAAMAPAAAPADGELAVPHVSSPPTLAGRRVLVVEDNLLNQELARELLERAGIDVVLAEDGAYGVERFQRDGPFDAVLMDCQMPVMDGYAATRQIRARGNGSAVPIIAMTASALAEDRRRALEAGMDAHLTKPLNIEQLLATLAEWIDRGGPARGGAAAAAAPAPAVAPGAEPIDTEAGLARCLDQPELYQRLMTGFRDGQAGFVALYRAAVREGRPDDAARALHDLTGLAGTIGAMPLHQLASQLRRVAGSAESEAVLQALARELQRVLARLEELLPAP